MSTRLILDVDTGTDDAVAIMLAALAPVFDLVACTTVFGNGSVADSTENTLRVLELLGRPDMPVHEGSAGPIRGAPVRAADPRSKAIHGDLLPLPPALTPAASSSAVDFLAATYARPSDIVLVATAPLTNLAMALARDAAIAGNIPRLVVMGGGYAVGNTTPSAEHNIWADPEAAAAVLSSGIAEIDLVTLDATHDGLFSVEHCAALEAIGTPPARAAAALIGKRITGYDATQPMATAGTAPVHDALCVALIADPSLVDRRHVHVEVELDGRLTRGRTVIDLRRRGSGRPNCHVVLNADGPRFSTFVVDVFASASRTDSLVHLPRKETL